MATSFLTIKNNATSTLSAGVGIGDLTISVTSLTPFPASYSFDITIDSEILRVTGSPGAGQYTVTRAAQGTSAATHSIGSLVELRVTAQSVSDLNTAVNTLENKFPVVNADVSATAAIAYSKLNLAMSITNADVAVAAGIVYSKLTLTNSIVGGDILTTTTAQIARLGLGVAVGATARITFPASAGLAAGLDFGGDVYLQRGAANTLTVTAPSGNTSLRIEVATAAGLGLIRFYESTTEKWRIYKDGTTPDLFIRNQDVVGSPYAIQNKNLMVFDQDRNAVNIQADVTGPTNSSHSALNVGQTGFAWDGGSTDGASSTSNRDRTRISFEHLPGFVNTTNGGRAAGDVITDDEALSEGASAFHGTSMTVTDWNGKGQLVPYQAMITMITAHTAPPNNYSECVPFVSYIRGMKSKGAYAGNWESLFVINNATDDVTNGGPVRGFGELIQVKERNTYASYNDTAIFGAGSHWLGTGARGIWMQSSGTQQLGTGIMLRGAGGYKRAFVLENTAATLELFCVDGTGNIGVRRSTNQTTTLAAALTVGYDSAGAASAVAGDGIDFGGDVALYRNAANVLYSPDAFGAGSTAASGASAGVFLGAGGRCDVTRASGGIFFRGYDVAAGVTNPAVELGTGGLKIGPGGGTPADTDLFRNSAGVWKTNGGLIVAGVFSALGTLNVGSDTGLAGRVTLSAVGGTGYVQFKEQTSAVGDPAAAELRIYMDSDSLMMKTSAQTRTVQANRAADVFTQTYATADATHANPTAVTLTDNTAGTANTTLEALVSGTIYATDVAAIRNNFADLAASNNAIIVDLADLKQFTNSLVDSLQAEGIIT